MRGNREYEKKCDLIEVAAHPLALKIMKYLPGPNAEYGFQTSKVYGHVECKRTKQGRVKGMMQKLEDNGLIKRDPEDKYRVSELGEEFLNLINPQLDDFCEATRNKAWDTVPKQEAMVKYEEFLVKSLGKKRSDIRVLCLPGLTFNERKVYKDMGIPEHNIFGVEHDGATARRLRQKVVNGTLKINLYEGELKEFVSTTDQKFDIIHLDFTEYLQPGHY